MVNDKHSQLFIEELTNLSNFNCMQKSTIPALLISLYSLRRSKGGWKSLLSLNFRIMMTEKKIDYLWPFGIGDQ